MLKDVMEMLIFTKEASDSLGSLATKKMAENKVGRLNKL
jgi:hypothetical protein